MKAIIETYETDLVSLDFKKGKKMISWDDMKRSEQIKILSALSHFHELFSKFIKPEESKNNEKTNN